jgi:hypothetical protein
MKKTILALAAVSLTVPALPQQAEARGRHHSQYYEGKVWRDSQGGFAASGRTEPPA